MDLTTAPILRSAFIPGFGRIEASATSTDSLLPGKDNAAAAWLMTSIVHDLRNPLATICVSSEILLDQDVSAHHASRIAQNIHSAAVRMRTLLEEFACFARGSAFPLEWCELRDLIAPAGDSGVPRQLLSRIQINVDIPERFTVHVVRSQIERVFFNLIANACEAMPAGGQISIKARREGDSVLIHVEDNGPGVPFTIRPHLFTMFVTANKPNGLGLGLALARQTILRHGGDIWFEPASGARFVIRLPMSSVAN